MLKWGDLRLDPNTSKVTYCSQPLHLTTKEYGLLELLLRNNHRVFSCGAILECLWAFEQPTGEDTVRSHMKSLQQKLKAVGVAENPIETVYGVGYRFKQTSQQSIKVKKRVEKKVSHVTPDLEQQTLAIITEVWERVKDNISQKVAVIEQAVAALLEDKLINELRRQAEQEAHKLAGSLGMFGFAEGSHVAQELEHLFQAGVLLDQTKTRRVSELVVALRQNLQGNPVVNTPQPKSVDERPLLLIVNEDESLAETLVTQVDNWEMRAEIAVDAIAARDKIECDRPDVVLLDLSMSDTTEDNMRLLAELSACTPPMPVLVLTAPDSSLDRVTVARLGGRRFLQKPIVPAQVLEAVTQVLQQARIAATKVMVVDDDPVILTALRSLLKPWEIKLATLADPRQFWDTLEASSPDLLVLDMEMPHLNGIELCQIVHNDLRWSGLPVLLLTAHTDADTMRQIFAAGADDYVSKPFVEPELLTRILNRLERSRMLRSIAETDVLTKVASRRKSTQELTEFLRLGKRYNQPVCFAILKVDRLKQINNSFGYAVGEQVLSRLGELLRQNFRSDDVIARLAGAEFVVGMYGMTRSDGVRRLSEVMETLHQESFMAADGSQFQATLSAGVIEYPQDGTDLQTLYQAADAALHQKKDE